MFLTVLEIIEKVAESIFVAVSIAIIVLMLVKKTRAWALRRRKQFTGVAAAFLLIAFAARIAVLATI